MDGSYLDFGPVVSGTSKTITVTLKNTGTAELSLFELVERGEVQPEAFIIGPLGATTLAPNAQTSISVTFFPVGFGISSQGLQIHSTTPHLPP